MEQSPSAVFVYGTLLPGHLRWPILAPAHVNWVAADVPGTLYDTGQGWPAAAFDPDAGRLVPGAIVRIRPDAMPPLLIELDEVEEVPDIFRRTIVDTTVGEPAWAWEWARPLDGLSRIDRWNTVDER